MKNSFNYGTKVTAAFGNLNFLIEKEGKFPAASFLTTTI